MKHTFKVVLNWISNQKSSDKSVRFYSKSHTIKIEGKDDLKVSAAKAFKGDPSLYNPEDLLLSSLTSCHMMSYLYCCSINDLEIISYQDYSEAFLEVNADGSGKITKVILRPTVTIKEEENVQLAKDLHQKASELCFIANSCNFLIEHEISIQIDLNSTIPKHTT